MKKSFFAILALSLFSVAIWQFAAAQTFENFIYVPIVKTAFRPAVVSFQVAYASSCAHAPANETDPPATFPNDVAKLALRTTLDGARGSDAKVVWIVEDVPVYEAGFEVESDREIIFSEYFGQPALCGTRQLTPGTYRVQLFANETFLYEGQIVISQ